MKSNSGGAALGGSQWAQWDRLGLVTLEVFSSPKDAVILTSNFPAHNQKEEAGAAASKPTHTMLASGFPVSYQGSFPIPSAAAL